MRNTKQWAVIVIGCALTAVSVAKLPAPVLTDEQKAKAEEAKAKAAEAAKKSAEALQRAQDRVAERYFREAKAAGKTVAPPSWVPATSPPAAAHSSTPVKSDGAAKKSADGKKS